MKYIFQMFQNIFCDSTQISLEDYLWDQKAVNTGNPYLIKRDSMFFISACKRLLLIIPLWLHMSYSYKVRCQDLWQHQKKSQVMECESCLHRQITPCSGSIKGCKMIKLYYTERSILSPSGRKSGIWLAG